MLTNQNIVEILDKIGKQANAKLSGKGVLFTKNTGDTTWTRQGTVHDVQEAMHTIDKWFAENNPSMVKHKHRKSRLDEYMAVDEDGNSVPGGDRVRVYGVREDGSMQELEGDFDGLSVEEIVDRIRRHDRNQQQEHPESISEQALAALDGMAKRILEDPSMCEKPDDVDEGDWATLVDGHRQTGIPPKLLGAICSVLQPQDEPGTCNCGHCIAVRLYPEVDPSSLTDLIKFAALKRIAATMGPQRGKCRLPPDVQEAKKKERDKRVNDALDKKILESIVGKNDGDGGGNKKQSRGWFPVKKVEGEQ